MKIDGVLEKLVFPDDNAVSKLVGGGLDVLDLQPDEFVKAYSKGGEPGVVLVGLKTSSNKFQKCFELENGAWVSSCSFDGSLKKLKEAAKEQLSFAIQLEDKQGNANCSVTEVMIANLQTRFFSPQCGFYATEVKDGENSVWKAEAGQKCGFVHLFSRGDSTLLTMGILGSSNAEHHCYEKVGGEWKEIGLNEFRQRSLEMDRAVQ
ncbi:hypothetical protein BEWA_025530 [Theileria equi strain WA]|uniref:Uncharacterized protein n=1 Tax=Theileria equi strain WA TaxID=1537102 RepID=L0AXR8_THEEQ|nr:hypothetical protein BEWA_025530 [Theileria equi strain WA]AFZ79704.1 hypothetical protein BEWA_025530 [Theileria equi strain WA]|eukprot:XP_004829370.1 hypothetical protein BEWA_025530 [Theileria equi strain WA]